MTGWADLNSGETVVAERPSQAKRVVITAALAGAVYAGVMALLNSGGGARTPESIATNLGVFLVVYGGITFWLDRRKDWVVTDQRTMIRSGKAIAHGDLAEVALRGAAVEVSAQDGTQISLLNVDAPVDLSETLRGLAG